MIVQVAQGYINTATITFIEKSGTDTVTVHFDDSRSIRLDEQDTCHLMFVLQPTVSDSITFKNKQRAAGEYHDRLRRQYAETPQ